MGDGREYYPTQHRPKVNKAQIAEYDKIFEECLREVRVKKAQK